MTSLDAKTIWQMPNHELVSLIENGTISNKNKTIRFYAPSFVHYKNNFFSSVPNVFPSISITGSSCALNCKHCNKKVLNTMIPAVTPNELFDACKKLKKNGALGCLISGGCLLNGSVPLNKFMGTIAKIKTELGLIIAVHTGIIDYSTAQQLKTAGVDSVLLDIIGSDETIHEIYNLDVRVKDYEQSLRALHDSQIPFVPHVLVGLHYGKLKGEFEALQMVAKYSPSAIILIAFMPIRGTLMEKVLPPEPEDILKTIVSAQLLMPNTPVVLGCMRPKGEHRKRTDLLAVKAGVNGIAFPVEDAIQLARSMSLKILYSSLCCSQICEVKF